MTQPGPGPTCPPDARNRPRRPAGRSWSPHDDCSSATATVATSIRAIAEEAGVAVQTVYAVFGNKRQLVIELVENAVTGDDHLVDSLAEDSETSAVRAEPDPRRRAQLGAALSRKIIERVLPVFKITSDAAAVDPDFAELNQAMIARRRAEMADGATLLAGHDGLRVSPDDAAASLFVLCSPHVAQLLTEHLGWSFDRYQTWLADAIERLILNDQITAYLETGIGTPEASGD